MIGTIGITIYLAGSSLQPHNSVLAAAKGLEVKCALHMFCNPVAYAPEAHDISRTYLFEKDIFNTFEFHNTDSSSLSLSAHSYGIHTHT